MTKISIILDLTKSQSLCILEHIELLKGVSHLPVSRDLQAQETRKKLLDSIHSLLSTTDYGKIRIADIAKNAGVSVGTMYLYFHSKSDLVTTLIRERNEMLTSQTQVDEKESVAAQYIRYVDRYRDMVLRDGYHFSRGLQLAMIEETMGHQATAVGLQYDYLIRLIETGFETGELRRGPISAEMFCEMFLCSINGVLLEWIYTSDDQQVLIRGMENTKRLIQLLQA